MKILFKNSSLAVLLLGSLILSACRTTATEPKSKAETTPASSSIRLNGYALLYELLQKQQNVDKLLLIKLETDELETMVESIATASANGANQLEQFAETDSSIDLQQTLLPPGEIAVREAIARTKREKLLEPFNSNFEIELLGTQAEALSYAWHLALVIAENEPVAKREERLMKMSREMKQLHDQVLNLLETRLRK